MKKLLILSLALILTACNTTNVPSDNQAAHSSDDHSEDSSSGASSLDRLNASPRHQEWVEVDHNGKTIYTWVVYPETSEKVPVVVLIHENKGLNDWARSMAAQGAAGG